VLAGATGTSSLVPVLVPGYWYGGTSDGSISIS
jgi:hypothetical protein